MQKLKSGCSTLLFVSSVLVLLISFRAILSNYFWLTIPMGDDRIAKRLIGSEWIHDEYLFFPTHYRKIYFVDEETAVLSFRFVDSWDGYGNTFERPWRISEDESFQIEVCADRNSRNPCEHWLTMKLAGPFGTILEAEGNLHILGSSDTTHGFYHQDFAGWYFFAPLLKGVVFVSGIILVVYGWLFIKRWRADRGGITNN